MIFNLILLIFLQPLFTSVFIFLGPVLSYFFKEKIKKLNLNLIFLSLIIDIIFIKPLGFFLFIASFSIFLICLLEKFLSHQYFYQKIIYLFLFNIIYLSLFFFLSFGKIISSVLFLKFLIFNIIFQVVYMIIDMFWVIRRR
jgi:hypothetical protein